MKVYAATGHRPNKLGGYSNKIHLGLVKFFQNYLKSDTPDRVISGMALGVDIAWAIAAINLDIPVTAAVPFEGQELAWPPASQERYHRVLARCSEIKYVSKGPYANYKMQVRNRWMVDHCTKLIALWDGSPGGTGNCIRYANSIGRNTKNLWADYQTYIGERA